MFKKLFISHSSEDLFLVEKIIALFEKTLEIPKLGNNEKAIRCSSMDEYKFSFGTSLTDQIPEEIKDSYFICVLTPSSLKSTWVLFELGAAWGQGRSIVPLIFDLDSSQLPAALNNTLAAKINVKNDVYGLIDQIAKELGWIKKGSERINSSVDEFMNNISSTSSFDSKIVFRHELIKELPWDKVLAKTKTELLIWAWSGEAAMNQRTRNLFFKLIDKGIYLKFMILNSEAYSKSSEIMEMHQICAWKKNDVKKDISAGREKLIEFRKSLTDHQKEYFILKETNWLMTWSGLAIDPESDNGLIQIENYLYNYSNEFSPEISISNHLNYRPNLLIDKSSKFFSPYYLSIKNMWKSASIIS
jgi:hypothetical protein